MTTVTDAKQRFSIRVEDYVKYRPKYPAEVIELLTNTCGLEHDATVADVGSGTGIFSQLLVKCANFVYAIEPNADMREAAAADLQANAKYKSIAGAAEETGLQANSVDLITSAQAFHWFDPVACKTEFQRILKPKGWVALIWNQRETHNTPFQKDYEELLRTYALNYQRVNHDNAIKNDVPRFFKPQQMSTAEFSNQQIFSFEGLRGRLLSSSYTPLVDHPNHRPMMEELQRLFDRHAENNQISIDYKTRIYYGTLD